MGEFCKVFLRGSVGPRAPAAPVCDDAINEPLANEPIHVGSVFEKLARKRHASGDGEASTKNNGHASNVCFRSHHSSGAAAA